MASSYYDSVVYTCSSIYQLVALLREIKYLNQRDSIPGQPIPESATTLFSRNETYQKYLQNLDVIVTLYNKVRGSLLDVEEPLVEEQLKTIDNQLDRATAELNWTSEGTPVLALVLPLTCTHVHACCTYTSRGWEQSQLSTVHALYMRINLQCIYQVITVIVCQQ